MTGAAQVFEQLFDLEVLGPDRFLCKGPATSWRRVYGGLVVAQALAAVARTVAHDRDVHSLHGYFLLPGDPAIPVRCEVDRLRDGRSFSTRHCRMLQNGNIIFTMTASFHREEIGLEHSTPMPVVPGPEELCSFGELQQRFRPEKGRAAFEYFKSYSPIEFRPVDAGRYYPVERTFPDSPHQYTWFRANGPLPENTQLHQGILAYASDMTLLDSTLVVHGRSVTDGSLQPASLDHAIWFHRPFRCDEWLLFVQESPNASAARALAIGRIYTRDGKLVASVAQEGLIRPIRK